MILYVIESLMFINVIIIDSSNMNLKVDTYHFLLSFNKILKKILFLLVNNKLFYS